MLLLRWHLNCFFMGCKRLDILESERVPAGFPAEVAAVHGSMGGQAGSLWVQPPQVPTAHSCGKISLELDIHDGKKDAPNLGVLRRLPGLTLCLCWEADQQQLKYLRDRVFSSFIMVITSLQMPSGCRYLSGSYLLIPLCSI